MVTRILKYEAQVDSDATDTELDTKSPGSGKQFEVAEVYSSGDSGHEFSLVFEERKLFDNLRGQDIADEDNGIPFDLTVGESQDLAVLASDTNSQQDTARFYIRVDETTA